ncbi:MAG: 6-phosphogluconolactonase [Deltaproteobacteria bacterium]|nr:6-phosphogluconolactonase [Deltaproteobacteria bacterium]
MKKFFYKNPEDLNHALADFICSKAKETLSRSNVFTWVLSGGNSPLALYELMAKPPCCFQMPWTKIHLFFGDERHVPFDHPDSNYFKACKTMVAHVAIPSENVHPIKVDRNSTDQAALDYELELRDFFSLDIKSSAFPMFDLVLLGMGTDGHVASLFPQDPALTEKTRWTFPVQNPGMAPLHPRITLTLPVINNANDVVLLITEPAKLSLVEKIIYGRQSGLEQYPVCRVKPRGELSWFVSSVKKSEKGVNCCF